jgi:hypothetical protein
MQHRDEIDATLAKHFAWTFVRPEEGAKALERVRIAQEAASAASGERGRDPVGGSTGLAADGIDRAPTGPGELHGERHDERSGDGGGAGPSSAFPAHLPSRQDADGGDSSRTKARVKARLGCRALAESVAEAWRQHLARPEDERACLQAVKRILLRADRLGVELLEMQHSPLEAVRMLRLFVRCGPKMTRRQRERSANVASLVPLDHPEAAELLVDVARAGDRVMADALLADDEWLPDVGEARDVEALAARLADVVDDGPTHACRVIAVELIARLEACAKVPSALRRALALPSFAVRAQALHALATARPCAVEPRDLVQVLRDLVTHAVPDSLSDDEHEENERVFAEAVLIALERLKPAGAGVGPSGSPAPGREWDDAAEAFLDWIDAEHDAVWLDAGWATEALAIAFPEAGAAMVDYWLKCSRAYDRAKALAALERLPVDLARPRLELAASDPAPSVRELARQKWLRRFGTACPGDAQGLVGIELLAGPPSDRFAARLVVMQGRVAEARSAMARAVLAEAPDPEALVLLLQFAGDDLVSSEPLAPHPRHASTSDPPGQDSARDPRSDPRKGKDWAASIATGFGALGAEGLCALAARFPEPESFGWLRRLGDLVVSGAIAREHGEPLRALAARHVASEDAAIIDDALRLLSLVGAPPELLDRALGLALDADLASSAARELILAWPGRAVDRRLASEMALALAERDWARVQCAASVALGRGAPAALVIAQRVLEVAEDDEGAVDAAVECAHRLRALGALDEAWALAALGRPASPIFTVAARVWRRSGAVRGALEAALASPARHGVSRAEAAISLLWGDPPLSPRDRRLPAVLVAAPPVERAELVHAMCIQGAPLGLIAPHLEALLTSSDPGVAHALIGIAHWLRSPKGQALLRAALPRVTDEELKADIEGEIGARSAPYWVEG